MAHLNDHLGGGTVKAITLRSGYRYLTLYDPLEDRYRPTGVIRIDDYEEVEVGDQVWWDGDAAFLNKNRDVVGDFSLGRYKLWMPGGE